MQLGTDTQVTVAGAGTMGIGIAQVLAAAGHKVHVVEPNERVLDSNKKFLFAMLDRLVEKRRLTADERLATVRRLTFGRDLSTVPAVTGLVVEAVSERLQVKQDLFTKLEECVTADAILATNTSSLSVTSIASACKSPDRVIGLHFFNPAPLLPLIEVVPALQSDGQLATACRRHFESIGRKPVVVKDTPGFIVNRIARPFYGEALRILDEQIANVITIDTAMKKVGGFRMGPFELMDLIGNDINYTVTESVYKSFFNDQRYRPSFTQKRMVEAGLLGRKSGAGYYRYVDSQMIADGDVDERSLQTVFDRIIAMLVNEAFDAVFWDVASPQDIETAMTTGVNYPKGLLAWGREIGFGNILGRMESLQAMYGEDRYRPSPLLRKLATNVESIDV